MVAPTDSVEINALDLLATPALGDLLHINDITDTNNSFKITLQTIIQLYDALAVTMTNKTLTTPTIGSFTNAGHSHLNAAGGGTITEAAISDLGSYITASSSDTLTNKTIDGDDNTIVDIKETQMDVAVGAAGTVLTSNGVGSAPTYQAGGAGDMILASAQTNTGIKTFLDTTMKLRNVANTFDGYFVNTNTADRIYTLPDETGVISLIGRTETLVGKTLTTPTISGTGFTNAQHAHTGATTGGQITEASISDLGTYFDTAGTGLTSSGGTVNVIGTASRITANANDIDIASDYVGQASITTLGTIATGTWQGTTVAVNQGGTGVTTSTGTTNVVLSGSPTIVTPTIASFVNATHDHTNAAGGGQIAASTALSDFANLALVAGDVYTGVHDFGGASSFELPNSDTPTVDATGEIALDTLITDHTPLLRYFSGAEELLVIAIPNDQLTSVDGHVISYNATDNEFEMVAAGAADNLGNHTATEIIKSVTFGLQGQNVGQTIIGTDASNAWTVTVPSGDAINCVVTGTGTIAQIDATGLDVQNGTVQEGGVDISPIGIHDIWIGATAMWPTTTAPCQDLTKTELGTNDVDIQTLDFDTAADEFAQFSMALPRNFDNATITFEVHWTAASGSGTVSWDVAALTRSEGDPLDAAFTDETTVTDTLTTADDLHISPTSADMSLTGHVDGDYIHFRVRRDISDDTLGTDAKLLGIHFHITTDAATAV